MLSDNSGSISGSKPLALIADDSRIVRATLMKHMHGLFEFAEALDGEQAWQALLHNEDIRLLITDLTMPRLDGYGLLRRMRASPSRRLREMPVVVVSGSDDADDRRQACEAGATDLITKGMPTSRLVARLDLLAQLVIAQGEHESEQHDGRLEGAQHGGETPAATVFTSPYAFQAEAEKLLQQAVRYQYNFALLSMSLCMGTGPVPADVRSRVGRLLKQTIRQTDLMARTGNADFTIAAVKLEAAGTRGFAERLCRTVLATVSPGQPSALLASCGFAMLAEYRSAQRAAPSLHELWDVSRRRGLAGLGRQRSGAVGAEEESAFIGS